MSTYIYYGKELYHHGILGQKWGQRRWQYQDGSLTPEGRIHYGYGEARKTYKDKVKEARKRLVRATNTRTYKDMNVQKKYFDRIEKVERGYKRGQNLSPEDMEKEIRYDDEARAAWKKNKEEWKSERNAAREDIRSARKEFKESDAYKARSEAVKKAAKIGLAAAGTALVAYGAYKYVNAIKNKAYIASVIYGKSALGNVIDKADSKMFFSDVDMFKKNDNIRIASNVLEKQIYDNANANSSTFKAARNYLKGAGSMSIAELENMGIKTGGTGSDIADDVLGWYRKYLEDGSSVFKK